MGILLEAVAQDGINYRDIYNSVGKATDNFTKPSGSFKYETNFEANLAKQILSDKYSRVYIKPLNMKNENELLYTVFFNGVIEDEPEEMAESLLESYLLKEDVEDDKEFVKQALIDHHELRELISKNKWEDLWKSIQKIYTRDSSLTPVQGGTLAIGKFIKVFSKAGVNYTIEVIPEYCFIASTDLTSFKIPDGTKVIGLAAFEKCVNLETVEIPESVTDIHNSAFRGCHSLKNIKLPSKLRIVAPDLFRACKSLQEIIIPENCIAIMDSAFRGCSSLKEVVVPKSCTSIGPGAFYHCNLESITLPDKKYYYMENMKKIGIDNMKKKNIHFSESLVEKIVKKGSQWQVQSEKGKNMGTYDTKEEAEKRLKQVEYFKHINEDDFEFMPDKNPAGTPLGNGTGLGEAFDDEEIEFCPICDRQMDFIGYQGNLSEFKCKTCNKYFYFDENGNEVDLGEDLNERFYNKERKEIEDTLLDGEPTFGEWLGQVYGMTEDEVEVEPEVEKYYLDSYSDYLNHLYDLDPVEYESDRPDDKRDFEYVALCSFEDWDKEGTSTEYFHTIEDAINWCNQEMADKGYDYVDIFEWGGVQGSTVATFYNGKWNTDYGEDDGESLNESPEDSDYGSIAPEAEVRDSVYQKQFNEMHETLVVSTKALLTSNSALSRLEKLRRNIGNVISNLGIDVNTLCKFAKPKSNTGYNDIATIKMGSMLKPVDFHITTGQIGEDGTPSILEINVDLFGMFTGWVSAPSNEYQYDDNYQDPKKLSAAVNFCDEQYSEQIIETLFERAYETLDRAVDKYGYAFKNESLTEALSPEKFSKALYNMDELGLTSDLSEAQFSYALNGIFGAELKRMKSPNYDKFMNGFYGDFTEVYPLLDVQGKQAATDFLVAHIFLPNSEGSEGREKAFIEEWWGQLDDIEDDKKILRDCGISMHKLKELIGETLWRFDGTIASFEKAINAGYFYSLFEAPEQIVNLSDNLKKKYVVKESLTEDKNSKSYFRTTEVAKRIKTILDKLGWEPQLLTLNGANPTLYVRRPEGLLPDSQRERSIVTKQFNDKAKELFGNELEVKIGKCWAPHNIDNICDFAFTIQISNYTGPTSEIDSSSLLNMFHSKKYLNDYFSRYGVEKTLTEDKNETLNQNLWDENKELRPEVKEVLEKIVDKYKDTLKDDDIDLDVKDVIIVGSNANYNYTPHSDIDLHIIADLSIYKDREDLAELLYNAYRRIFNDKYTPTIRGTDVEIYVEPYEDEDKDQIPDSVENVDESLTESSANSNGVYSLYNGWLKEPVRDEIPDVDLEPELSEWVDKSKECNTIDEVNSFIDDIYKLRQESILKDGEYGKGNLIFKEIRNQGILQALKDKKTSLENDEMSIKEEYHEIDQELATNLFTKYWPCEKRELDDIWDEIMETYDDAELAEEVCASLEERIDDMYAEALKPEKIEEEVIDDESEYFRQKNEACIKEYRQWAGLGDDELITEDKINEWALNRVSCNNNYDYNDLKEVLLSSNK